LAALKQAYETFGSECDDEEWDARDVAMVVKEQGEGDEIPTLSMMSEVRHENRTDSGGG
jgi:hypothetical protein